MVAFVGGALAGMGGPVGVVAILDSGAWLENDGNTDGAKVESFQTDVGSSVDCVGPEVVKLLKLVGNAVGEKVG